VNAKVEITDPTQDLVVLRDVIPWEKIITQLSSFYSSGGTIVW